MHTPRISTFSLLAALAAVLLLADTAAAQRDNSSPRPSPNATVSQTLGTNVISLHYSRPGVKGRTVYGDLVPYGEVWRAGANEPTTLTVGDPVMVEGEPLAAGTYALFVRPVEDGDWEVLLTEPVRWGTMYDENNLVLQVTATPQEADHQEWLQYRFEDLSGESVTLVMHWAGTMLPVVISAGGQ